MYDVREHGYSAQKESDQHHQSVHDVQRRLLHPHLRQDAPEGHERGARLHQVHEPKETVAQTSP